MSDFSVPNVLLLVSPPGWCAAPARVGDERWLRAHVEPRPMAGRAVEWCRMSKPPADANEVPCAEFTAAVMGS